MSNKPSGQSINIGQGQNINQSDYNEVGEVRGNVVQQFVEPAPQFFGAVSGDVVISHQRIVQYENYPEAVKNLLAKTDRLILQALAIPPSDKIDAYPDRLLQIEETLRRIPEQADVTEVEIELRHIEFALLKEVLTQNTLEVEADQARRKQLSSRTIPAIMIAFSALSLLAFLLLNEQSLLPFFNIPLSVLLAGWLGGITALYYRYRKITSSQMREHDLTWFLTKPLIGLLMAGLTYAALQAGFFVFQGDTNIEPDILWPFWVVAWLVGFSDWFFDTLIVGVVGKITGDENQNVVDNIQANVPLSEREIVNETRNQLERQVKETVLSVLAGRFDANPDGNQPPETEPVANDGSPNGIEAEDKE